MKNEDKRLASFLQDSHIFEMLVSGILVGLLPTLSMMVTSFLAFQFSGTSSLLEVIAQNLCAGLIVGAVAKELFPELGSLDNSDSFIGVSLGFLLGCFFFQGMDKVVELLETGQRFLSNLISHAIEKEDESLPLYTERIEGYQSIDPPTPHDIILSEKDNETGHDQNEENDSENSDEQNILLLAKQAMASPGQRFHIQDELSRISKTLEDLQGKANELSARSLKRARTGSSTNSGTGTPRSAPSSRPAKANSVSFQVSPSSNTIELELLAEQIDEEMHRLQYFIDHCRRLIHGSGAAIDSVLPRIWISEQSIAHLQAQLLKMKEITANISDLLCTPPQIEEDLEGQGQQRSESPTSQIKNLSKTSLKILYQHLDDLEKELNTLHGAVEDYTYKWGKRSKRANIPIPEIGSTIPMSFLLPVTVDCVVDGFLLGITASISLHAGGILSVANSIEMGFLGLAVSIRIQKCTGSSLFARMSSLVLPPLIMFGSALLSLYFGTLIKMNVLLYKLFISFGIIALLSLVINELLVEARDLAGKMEVNDQTLPWWSGMIIFFGIYLVLLMDVLLPSGV